MNKIPIHNRLGGTEKNESINFEEETVAAEDIQKVHQIVVEEVQKVMRNNYNFSNDQYNLINFMER